MTSVEAHTHLLHFHPHKFRSHTHTLM